MIKRILDPNPNDDEDNADIDEASSINEVVTREDLFCFCKYMSACVHVAR